MTFDFPEWLSSAFVWVLVAIGLTMLGVTVWEGWRHKASDSPGFRTSLAIAALLLFGSLAHLLGWFG